MTFQRLLQNLQSLNLQNLASEAVAEHTAVMADMNRKQLLAGKDSSGNNLSPLYRFKWYADYKQAMSHRQADYGIPDLYKTGATHRSIAFQVQGDKIVNTVNDQYSLERRYSENDRNPFLLTKESKEELIKNHLKKTFIDKCRQQIFK
jgi:hypothetical protein